MEWNNYRIEQKAYCMRSGWSIYLSIYHLSISQSCVNLSMNWDFTFNLLLTVSHSQKGLKDHSADHVNRRVLQWLGIWRKSCNKVWEDEWILLLPSLGSFKGSSSSFPSNPLPCWAHAVMWDRASDIPSLMADHSVEVMKQGGHEAGVTLMPWYPVSKPKPKPGSMHWNLRNWNWKTIIRDS